MAFAQNLYRYVLVGLLTFIAASAGLQCPAPGSDKGAALQTCMAASNIHNVISTEPTYADAITAYQKRLTPSPAAIAYPTTKEDIIAALACARTAGVKVTALGSGHSFQLYGYGEPGGLVISMAAFNAVSYDPATQRVTYGGGTRVGPVAKYLWDMAGRHFPHARCSSVGLGGMSTGGAFGTTSRFLGLTMDNLHEVELILADGSIVKAHKGDDLFWAAQGAVASYGIVLSLTVDTYKPAYPNVVNFTMTLPNITADAGARALVAVQTYAMSKACPDELAIRMWLTSPPKKYGGVGYYYGDPAKFDTVIKPLVAHLNAAAGGNVTVLEKTELPFWEMEVEISGEGMNEPDGGDRGGSPFYLQSLVVTSDHPLTVAQAKTLFQSTALSFNHTDMTNWGFLDLWGGVSRDVKDTDTAYTHGKNLWLIRWDGGPPRGKPFPDDGISYMRRKMKPFENALVAGGASLRGFVNYADTELSKEEWIARLYGANYPRLQKIKAAVDPDGLFDNHKQAITSPSSRSSNSTAQCDN